MEAPPSGCPAGKKKSAKAFSLGLTRETVKYLAAAAMLLNHIANVFLPEYDPAGEVMKGIGYFTAPCMIYFLVEGYHFTRSRKKYLARLLIFAVISEFPYCLALGLGMEGQVTFVAFDMLFSLSLCMAVIWIKEHLFNEMERIVIFVVVFMISLSCDWFFMAPIFTLLFLRAWRESGGDASSWQVKRAFVIAALLYGGYTYLTTAVTYGLLSGWTLFCGLVDLCGVGLAGVCITRFYNGKKGAGSGKFSKWFFYIFYPAHLALLGLIKLAVM